MPLDVLAWLPSGGQWMVILVIGLLLFGKRLPEVGRSLGQGIVQFKKGLKDAENEIAQVDSTPALPRQQETVAQQPAPAFKFDPYTGKPLGEVTQQESNKVG
jgi:sec-independent protein translocase protein TatA